MAHFAEAARVVREESARRLAIDWEAIRRAAAGPIRLGLRRGGLGAADADDALQEFLFDLIRCDGRRLRSFRGSTEGEFAAFVRVVARRFACRYVRRSRTRRRREEKALARTEPPDRSGPTEAQILAARRRIEAAMTLTERARLRAVSSLDESLRPVAVTDVPAVTLRRWRRELVARYGPRLAECVNGSVADGFFPFSVIAGRPTRTL